MPASGRLIRNRVSLYPGDLMSRWHGTMPKLWLAGLRVLGRTGCRWCFAFVCMNSLPLIFKSWPFVVMKVSCQGRGALVRAAMCRTDDGPH